MKRIILLFALILTLTLALCLVSCEDNEDSPASTESTQEPERVTVEFDTMGGSIAEGSYGSKKVIKGNTISEKTLPEVVPPYTYDFLYWAYDKEGVDKWYFDDRFYENTTLYAIYDDNMVNVSFDFNGGILVDGKDTVQVQEGNHLNSYYLPDLEKAGYDLIGWSYKKDDPDLEYAWQFTDPITEDVTLYAIWEMEMVRIDFIITQCDFANGEVINSVYVPRYGKLDPSLIPEIIIPNDRRFVCWSYDSYGYEVWDEDDTFDRTETLWGITELIN